MIILVMKLFLYNSSVYSCHLFLISSASVRSIPFLSFRAAGGRSYPMPPHPRPRAAAGRSNPTPEARGSDRGEQPHVQGALAAWAQEALEELSHVEGQEGRR